MSEMSDDQLEYLFRAELPAAGRVPTAAPSVENVEHWVHATNPNRPNGVGRSGKWLIFVPRDRVDAVWTTIKKAVKAGELGTSAKVSTARGTPDPTKERVICVYTVDYKDLDDVGRVRDRLFELGWQRTLYYKADYQTARGESGSLYRR